jgi:hypothetical protein
MARAISLLLNSAGELAAVSSKPKATLSMYHLRVFLGKSFGTAGGRTRILEMSGRSTSG